MKIKQASYFRLLFLSGPILYLSVLALDGSAMPAPLRHEKASAAETAISANDAAAVPPPASGQSASAPAPERSFDNDPAPVAGSPLAAPSSEGSAPADSGGAPLAADAAEPESDEEGSENPAGAYEKEASDEEIHSQLDLGIQPGERFTEDRKLCTKKFSVQPDDNLLFILEGPVNRNVIAFSPAPLSYCFNLVLSDFSSGSYKLTVKTRIKKRIFFKF